MALISDTHYPERARSIVRLCREVARRRPELILHAGDLTGMEVLEELQEIAPSVAVQGNMDELHGLKLPESRLMEIGEHSVLLHHGRGIYPRGDRDKLAYLARENSADVVVTGHTHSPSLDRVGGVTVINPGSPTVPRHSQRSFFTASFGEEIDVKLVKL